MLDATIKRSASMRITDFRTGWTVVGNDGHRLGTIKEVGHDDVLVSHSMFSADL